VTLWHHNDVRDDLDQTVGVYFYSQHPALQYCGMPEYIRHFSHEKYLNLTTTVFESEDVVMSNLGSVGGPEEKDHASPVCYDDGGRMMCTMPYLICMCSDMIGDDSSNRSIHAYTDVYCYFDPYDSPDTASRTGPINDCYMLLAESNGYTL